ncbi:hypothetical protein ACIQ9J_22210 [Streptomyces sp. NPDC094153]|uniref:hypothetical protein n=1 Tax=Streptomyces sp. NPDC094153 TaxID=3366058 RepID=UPI003822F697
MDRRPGCPQGWLVPWQATFAPAQAGLSQQAGLEDVALDESQVAGRAAPERMRVIARSRISGPPDRPACRAAR